MSVTYIKNFNNRYIKKNDKYIVIVIALIASVMRIIVTNMLGTSFQYGSGFDDLLLMQYADLPTHFTLPDIWSLVKTLSFPLFLNLPNLTGISYCLLISLTWILAGVLTVCVFKQLCDNKFFLLFVYLIAIFTPIAFSESCTRLYRNAIIPQFTLMVFDLIFYVVIYVVKDKVKFSNLILSNIFLGLVSLFTIYIKEDGVWMYYCLVLCVVFNIIVLIIQYIVKRKSKKALLAKTALKAVIIILPVVIFSLGTHIYKSINYDAFGVYEINTRTEGEIGKFCSNVYRIDSEDRTGEIWAPSDAIDKAFEASETLSQQYPELKDAIYSVRDSSQSYPEIRGDFLGWYLRMALSETKIWKDEKQVSDLFKQVNSEIEEAFSQGKLKEDEKFRLVASTAGKTSEEILDLLDGVKYIMNAHINIKDYVFGGKVYSKPYSELENRYQESLATYLTGEYITLNVDDSGLSDEQIQQINDYYKSKAFYNNLDEEMQLGNAGNQICRFIYKAYSVVNPILFILTLVMAVLNVILLLIKKTRKKIQKEKVLLIILVEIFIIALLLLSFAYAFAISWFTSFIGQSGLVFYSVAIPPLLLILELFGLYLFVFWIKKFFWHDKDLKKYRYKGEGA